MVTFWQGLAEHYRLVIYSSKIYRNHTPMDLAHMRAYLDHALGELLADRGKVILTGLSGGGSFSHVLNAAYRLT